jgi:hypothetical protein
MNQRQERLANTNRITGEDVKKSGEIHGMEIAATRKEVPITLYLSNNDPQGYMPCTVCFMRQVI